MHAISTVALLFILVLTSSLAVVLQAKPVGACTTTIIAAATTCDAEALVLDHTGGYNASELAARMYAYNDNVNLACSNLIVGQTVRIFLLQTSLYPRGVTKG